jgi:hypothetical protein
MLAVASVLHESTTITSPHQRRLSRDEGRWISSFSVNTIAACRDAGALAFVAGNAVFKHPAGIQAGIRALRDAPPV